MNILSIAWKNLRHNLASSVLGSLLTAFGIGILTVLLIASNQIEDQLQRNSRGIDLVIGAKGSPLQLILSSIYHTDYPTGNIVYSEALQLAGNPMVRQAVPLSLGDNFQGFRIVGTDSDFFDLYHASLDKGRLWQKPFEAVVGSDVALQENLRLGDKAYSSHGLTKNGDIHKEHPYIITGILHKTGTIADRLILANLQSVWQMHEDHAHEHDEEPEANTTHDLVGLSSNEKEITSMLIQYRSPGAIAMFPRMVNQSTNMQAASPAMESARLFSLIGVGIDTLEYLAYVIMAMALISIFVSLYHALKARKFDLAIMRTLGASPASLFVLMLTEGMLINFAGSLLGIAFAHTVIYFVRATGDNSVSLLQATKIIPQEGLLLLAGIISGFIAALLPAIAAYKTPISRTLAAN